MDHTKSDTFMNFCVKKETIDNKIIITNYKVNIANIEIRNGRISQNAIIHDSYVNLDNQLLYFVTDNDDFTKPFWVTKKQADSSHIYLKQSMYF
jgi:hypothetical protein